MYRGQAELISTVIIVGIAITLAFGLVYYLTPLMAQARAQQQIYAQLSQVASGLSTSLLAYENNSGVVDAVISITNIGAQNVRLYYGVLGFDERGVPRVVPVYWVFNMTSPVAELPVNSSGWSLLHSINVSAGNVYVYVKDGYYTLGGMGLNETYVLYDGGVLKTGETEIIGFRIVATSSSYRYMGVIYIMINNDFYTVAILPFSP